jgi:hypothetical protein
MWRRSSKASESAACVFKSKYLESCVKFSKNKSQSDILHYFIAVLYHGEHYHFYKRNLHGARPPGIRGRATMLGTFASLRGAGDGAKDPP